MSFSHEHRSLFVLGSEAGGVFKCSMTSRGPPLTSKLTCSLNHKLAHSEMRMSALACFTNSQQISVCTIYSHKTSMWAVSPSKAAQALSPKQWVGLDYLFILFVYFISFFFFSFFSCTQFQFQGRKYDLTECFSLNKVFKKGSKNADLSNKS